MKIFLIFHQFLVLLLCPQVYFLQVEEMLKSKEIVEELRQDQVSKGRTKFERAVRPSRSIRPQLWNDEEAPLHLAAYCGHNDVVGMLVDRGADIDAFNVYRDTLDCVTPLHFAVYKNKISTVRLLLRMGADPTLYGKWGRAEGTPIQFARLILKRLRNVNAQVS